jgi:hypothetical protein
MKNLKKLSAAFMLAALLSSGLTSCIDNEVSPLVESIYANQAALIAAQTAVQTAEANYTQAQADYRDAQTRYEDERTAGLAASNAYSASQREQYLLQLIAQTNYQVAQNENALAIAQANFDIQMANLIAQLEAAGANLAAGYASDYAGAMGDANGYLADKLDADEDLALANLMLNGAVSWEYALAQLQGDIDAETAAKDALILAIADMQAVIADPATSEAMVSDLEAQNEALEASIAAKDIELQTLYNELMAIYEENDVRDDFIDRFVEAKDDLDDAIGQKEDKEEEISDLEDEIADLMVVLADYPAALAAAELAVTDADAAQVVAEDAIEAAELALGTETTTGPAIDPEVTLYDALYNRGLELTAANDAWTVLDDAVDDLNGTYQAAIAAFALAQLNYDAGAAALTAAFDAAELALTTGEGLVATNQLDYDAKKAAFELNPNGFVWAAGVDTVLGIHPTAVGPHASYSVVTSIAPIVVGAVTVSAGSGADLTALGTYASFLAGTMDGGGAEVVAINDYYNVGADDVAGGTNGDRLDAALVALTSALNAIDGLETAVETAQDNIDNADTILATAETLYFAQRDLYEGQVALLAAAVLAQEAAVTAEEAAQDAVDAAVLALGTLITPAAEAEEDAIEDAETLYELLWNAELAALDAAAAVTVLEDCDADCIQESIDDKTAEIAECNAIIAAIQPIIDAKQAVVDSMQVEYDALITSEGYLSSLDADLHAAIIAKWQAYWLLENEQDVLDFQIDLNDELIDAYGSDNLEDLADDLADLQDELAEAMEAIEEAEVALAEAQVEEAADVAYLTYLQAIIDEAQANYDAALALAAEYKALMDAALAN